MKAGLKFHHRQVKLFGCVLAIMLVAVCARGQGKEEKVFDAVPEASRARLVERLKLYVEYQRAKDYEKLYDLYTESTIKNIYKGQSREEFAAACRKGDALGTSFRLVKLTPTAINKATSDGLEGYDIYGDAELIQSGKLVERYVLIEAQLKNGEWYFSEVGEVLDN
jgi:hypothetical protein